MAVPVVLRGPSMRGTPVPMMAEGSLSTGLGGAAGCVLAWAESMKAMNSLKCLVSPGAFAVDVRLSLRG
jgi:hypothetical protein